MTHALNEPTWRHRNRSRLRYAADLLEAIHERIARADASTATPPRRPTGEYTSGSYVADPVALTAADRDQIFRTTHEHLGKAVKSLEAAASGLRHWAPNPTPDDLCACNAESDGACCPSGCHRHVPPGHRWHATCTSKLSKARVRGDDWATLVDTRRARTDVRHRRGA